MDNLGLPTLAATMDELTRCGFTEHFIPVNGGRRAVGSGSGEDYLDPGDHFVFVELPQRRLAPAER
jgi:hypothetical protein